MRYLFASVLMAAAIGTTAAAAAEVRSATTLQAYPLGGYTPRTIVDYFHNRPLAGDRGPALANLHYSASVRVDTRESGGRCRAVAVGIDMNFVITLPQASEEARMSRATRSMWRQVAAFARQHEYGHRAMYLQCARNFVARAKRVSAESCWAVESAVRQMWASEEAACDARQIGYDRREAKRAGNLSLFRAARQARR